MKRPFYLDLVKIENGLRHPLLLLLRLYFGGQLIATGLGKLIHMTEIGEYFRAIGIPSPVLTAGFVGFFEAMGGISLVLGLLTRYMTIPLAIIFLVAYATAHTEAITAIFINPSLFVKQEVFLYLLTTLIVLTFGPGFFSIDYWAEKKRYGKPL